MIGENSVLKYNNQSLDETVRAKEEQAKQLQSEVSHMEGVLRQAFSIFTTHACSDSDRSPLNIEDLVEESSFLESEAGMRKFLPV
mmetsp:Transcript_52443/g.162770  ORF Transcript_52443/g.162770 Transcript_52443/m.162770 type:complete len:85 (+) Transcript_52443:717-971(+)